jgi:hypothetical protein
MIPTVEANGEVILGDQNCSTCKLTYPLCGKKKAVQMVAKYLHIGLSL